MDPMNMTLMQRVLFGAAIGLIVGLLPLIVGIIKGRAKIGIIGFLASITGGSAFALLLALPISLVFAWLAYRKPRAVSDNS